MSVSNEEMKILLKAQQGELSAVLMYKALADAVKDPKDREIFLQLAAEEGHHAAVFKKLTGQTLAPKKTLSVVLPLLYKGLGRKRLYPIIAKGEYRPSWPLPPSATLRRSLEAAEKQRQRQWSWAALKRPPAVQARDTLIQVNRRGQQAVTCEANDYQADSAYLVAGDCRFSLTRFIPMYPDVRQFVDRKMKQTSSIRKP